MNSDEQVEWAEKISEGLRSVGRNEFRTWIEFLQKNNLDLALGYAQKLSQSKMLRKQQKEAFGQIFHGIRKYRNELSSMSDETVSGILGYVMWELHIWKSGEVIL